MPNISRWREVESCVYRPGRWLIFAVGTLFFVMGVVGFLTIGEPVPAGMPVWVVPLGTAAFALLGATVLAWVICRAIAPGQIRHAAADVLPYVPRDPVIYEGAVVHGRLTHELWEDAAGWQLRPAEHLWRHDKRFLLGFGIPFLLFFSGLLTWVFHSQLNIAGWFGSAIFAATYPHP